MTNLKRIVIATLVLQMFAFAMAVTVSARDIWDSPRTTVQQTQVAFLRVRDEYSLRYALGGLPAGTHQVRANFWSTTGVYYDAVFDNPTGVAYLTCNGTYIFEILDRNGNTISETRQIITHKIVAPACRSYENAGLKNDLQLVINKDDQNRKYHVNVNYVPSSATKVEYHRDGEYQFELPATSPSTSFDFDQEGIWTIVAKDANGNMVGSSDFTIGGLDGGLNNGGDGGGDNGGGEGGSGACDACKWLKDALACPSWDEYMGELTDAIKAALPPPTDWDAVASTFVRHFANYFGDVPTPPSKEQIDRNVTPPLPTLDTSVPDANMTPQVPSDFNNGPLDTDITTGDEIEIVDESEPIEIYEPDKYIDSDAVGEMVFPNDPRNHSDGIKAPETIDTGYNEPTPQPVGDNIPEVEMPLPSSNESTMPTPQPNDYVIPIPTIP